MAYAKYLEGVKMMEQICAGMNVTILVFASQGNNGPEYKERTGRAVMKGPAGWVLNMGGRHGKPEIATPENIVRVEQ